MATRPSPCSEEPRHIPRSDLHVNSQHYGSATLRYTTDYKFSLFGFQRKPSYQQRNLIMHLRKRICQKIAPSEGSWPVQSGRRKRRKWQAEKARKRARIA